MFCSDSLATPPRLAHEINGPPRPTLPGTGQGPTSQGSQQTAGQPARGGRPWADFVGAPTAAWGPGRPRAGSAALAGLQGAQAGHCCK